MTTPFRSGVLAIFIVLNATCGIAVNAAWAEEGLSSSADEGGDWRDNILRNCVEQYGAAQCADEQFLEDNFHLKSLETARNTATQRSRDMQKALHELILQRVCSVSTGSSCAGEANGAQCAAQIEHMCATLKTEADNCVSRVGALCASDADINACKKRRIALCPSLKKQPIAQLLAKYPKLSATQKTQLTSTAAGLDARTSGWWSNLTALLKVPFQ